MKKFYLMLICGLLTIPILGQAFRTYRVNNMLTENTAAKIYTTLQAAHDAANNGDTILVEGSPVQYSGEFKCEKKLVIKGPGYFLHENPGISANKARAEVWLIRFYPGSVGSTLMGMEIYYAIDIDVDDITVRRCHLHGCSIGAVKNVKISECIFSGGQGFGGGSVTNLTIANCIINRDVAFGYSSPSHGTGTFINNIFTVASVAIPTGFIMKNNIFFFTEKTSVYLPSLDAAVSYNMSISDHFGTANNNKADVSATALFVGVTTGTTDGMWQLKAGSPAIGAGENGLDCGAFGGPNPYILSGLSVGPTIYELNVSSYATPAGKLPMTIKVKSH